jgi:prepilin-type processing-associated H-X9-DG protein
MGRKWRWPLKPYMAMGGEQDGSPMKSRGAGRNVLLCPSDRLAAAKWDSTSYSYSMAFYHSPEQINSLTSIEDTWTKPISCRPQSQSFVKYPDKKVLAAEWLSNHESPNVAWNSWEGGRVYLFADGHCRYLKARQIRAGNDGWPDVNLTHDGIRGRDVE